MKRKPGLGHYNATRDEWNKAYRHARILKRTGGEVDSSLDGIWWKAQLIIFNERNSFDWYSMTAEERLWMQKETDSLLNEILAEA